MVRHTFVEVFLLFTGAGRRGRGEGVVPGSEGCAVASSCHLSHGGVPCFWPMHLGPDNNEA